MSIVFTLIFLALPAALLYLSLHQCWAKKLGAIILCYGTGLLMGNLGLIPNSAAPIQNMLSEITIALALPMLLFTLNVKQWSRVAGKAMLSMMFATTTVVAMASSLYFYFQSQQHNPLELSHLAGMSVGVYTGGTPNLAAIKAALNIPNESYLLFHSFDTLIGATYMLLMISVAIPFFRYILKAPSNSRSDNALLHETDEDDYSPLLKKTNTLQMAKVFALAIVVLASAVGLSEVAKAIFHLENTGALIIVLLTTLGIGLSLNQHVRSLELAYKMGMYLILVFCLVVASMANLKELLDFDPVVAIFLFATVIGSLILHALLCKLSNVDSDTFMVTSVSAICSPPFVPMMAKALNNPNVLLSGMTTGIIGYALGNYLGISLALFLQTL